MKKIKMNSISSGPDGVMHMGQEYTIASAMADQWGKRYTCFGTGEVAEFRCAQ